MDEINQGFDIINRCLWDDAVTQIKDMARSTADVSENLIGLRANSRLVSAQHNRVEISLDSRYTKRIPGCSEWRPPIKRDHVDAKISYLWQEM